MFQPLCSRDVVSTSFRQHWHRQSVSSHYVSVDMHYLDQEPYNGGTLFVRENLLHILQGGLRDCYIDHTTGSNDHSEYVRCRVGFDLSSKLAKFINSSIELIPFTSSCVR